MSKNQLTASLDFPEVLKSFDGDATAYRRVFEALGHQIPAAQVLLVSTFPRGGTQILQPSHVPESFLKAYSKGMFAFDGPTWQAVLQDKPLADNDCVAT